MQEKINRRPAQTRRPLAFGLVKGDIDIAVCAPKSDDIIEYFINYPQSYGTFDRGSKKASIKLKGNIRVDLHIDGTTVFDVENVPDGEEQVCRNMVTSIAEAISKEDMNLEVKDWGRASKPEGKQQGSSPKLRERARERVRD